MAEERLQKVLASAGVASRRACEEIITAGRVNVNGVTVTELGTKVDSSNVQITVDGKPIQLPDRHIYVKLHKPRGILGDSGHEEESVGGRDSIIDLLPEDMRRVFPVGRLDLHSEGLVLLTDDGEMAHKLTHPRYHHSKTYFVLVEQRPTETALQTLRKGVDLPEGRTAPALVRLIEQLPPELRLSFGPNEGVWLEVTLFEGKKRQIRHMTAAVGYPTLRLIRWAIGPLTLDNLRVREHVHLTPREVAALRNLVAGNGVVSSERQTSRSANPRQPIRNQSNRGPLNRGPSNRSSANRSQPNRSAGNRLSENRSNENRNNENRSSERSAPPRQAKTNRNAPPFGKRTDDGLPQRSASRKRKPNL